MSLGLVHAPGLPRARHLLLTLIEAPQATAAWQVRLLSELSPPLTTQLLAADLSLLRFDAEALDCIRQTLSQPSSSSVARAAVFAARSGAAPLALEVLNLKY